jgi:O-antigen ligase
VSPALIIDQILPRQKIAIGRLIFIGFLLGLAICPFWFGSNTLGAWGVNAVYFSALLITYELSLLINGNSHPFPIGWIRIPAVCFALVAVWCVIQMSPSVPKSWTYPIWEITSETIGRELPASISVNPDLTMLALVRLMTAAAVFWLALQLGRNFERSARTLEAISVIGACYAAYGVISFIVMPDRLLWLPKPINIESVTSTFVNRNNFATYAGITLVTCIAVTMSMFRRRIESIGGSKLARFAEAIITATGKGGYFLLCVFIISAALMLTGSRGGIFASIFGIIILVLAMWIQSKNRLSLTIWLFSAAVVAISISTLGDLFFERLESIGTDQTDRRAVYQLVIQSIHDSPLLGFGYGTFVDVFPLYRDASVGSHGFWDKAHNTPLEVIQGLGIPASMLLFVCVGWLIWLCFKSILSTKHRSTPCLVAVAASAIVLLHGLIDFSLQIQAVTLTWCAILGTGVAQFTPRAG